MLGTTIGTEPALIAFRQECEQFEANMKKSMTRLQNAILSARSGWKDGGFDNIQRMVANVGHGVVEIEKTVTAKVIPFVDKQIEWFRSQPR